jgi:hypothetical protein
MKKQRVVCCAEGGAPGELLSLAWLPQGHCWLHPQGRCTRAVPSLLLLTLPCGCCWCRGVGLGEDFEGCWAQSMQQVPRGLEKIWNTAPRPFFLRHGSALCPRLAWNLRSSCLHLLCVGIIACATRSSFPEPFSKAVREVSDLGRVSVGAISRVWPPREVSALSPPLVDPLGYVANEACRPQINRGHQSADLRWDMVLGYSVDPVLSQEAS